MFLPLFPLKLVVFPGEDLNLHIFEPRYKQLIRECDTNNSTFGIPPFCDGELADHGTEMELLAIDKVYPDGEMDILTRGLHVFHLDTFMPETPEKLYYAGMVTRLPIDPAEHEKEREEMLTQYARFHELLQTGRIVENPAEKNLSYRIAPEVGMTLTQKVELLSMTKESDRQDFLIKHLHTIIPFIESAEETKRRVDGNGSFQKLPQVDV